VASSTSNSRPLFYGASLLLALGLCFGAQSLILRQTGGRTTKSESNYFSSVARIQSGVRGEPEVMLLGSSMTGRLPDRTRGFEGVANLGCDGGSALDALGAMDAGAIPAAPRLIIEGNTLFLGVKFKESEVGEAMHSRWFRTGIEVPNLGAAGRPSSIAYSLLMERKVGGTSVAEGEGFKVDTRPAMVSGDAGSFDAEENEMIDHTAGILRKLVAGGSRITIVMLPPAEDPSSLKRRLPEEMARRAGVPFWDLASAVPAGEVRFTDRIHMDAASATSALRTLLSATAP